MAPCSRWLALLRAVMNRNPGLKWLLVLGLALIAAVWLPTPLRANFWRAFDKIYSGGTCGTRDCGSGSLSLGHNDDPSIESELNSKELRALLARAAGLALWRIEHLSFTVDHFGWTSNGPVPPGLSPFVSMYVSARGEGHSAAYARDLLNSVRGTPSGSMAFLATLRQDDWFGRGIVPESRVSRVERETVNGRERVKSFVVVDGGIAWLHWLQYDEVGDFKHDWTERIDAMEFDPRFTTLIEEANKAADERMVSKENRGLGSCHSFWSFKKEYLRVRGHEWKSPSELNPNACYD